MIRCVKCGKPLTDEDRDPVQPFTLHRVCAEAKPAPKPVEPPDWMIGRDDPADRR
jgi:hypothetical protein